MVDYVSKRVEAMPCRKAFTEESIAMIKSMIFPRFDTPRILISDGGTHFTGKNFKKCLSKLGIEHRVSTAYHPQTNRQAKTSNRQLKSILNKTIENGGKDWSKKLDGALWAYRTVFKILIGMTLYQFVYGKACHLPVELEHKSYWAIKEMNLDLDAVVVKRRIQISELEEMTLCQMVRSRQPTGVLIPMVYLFRGRSQRLRTRRLHTSRENTENTASLYWSDPPESNTLHPVVSVDCLRIGLVEVGLYKWSPRTPYIGQRIRSVPILLVGYEQETYVYVTHLSISRQSVLGEVHRGLVLYAKS
jgi:hypothetical protein